MNFEKDLKIDESALDVEWIHQPELFMRYAEELAFAQLRMNESKNKLEITKSKLDNAIRKNPDKFGLAKITEGAIANAIVIQDSYQEKLHEYHESIKDYDLALNAVQAMNQRKTALENLVRLHGQKYFAGPQEPRDLSYEVKQKHESNVSNERVRMKRNKKQKEDEE